ncbi:MAG: TIGR00296 family protein [Thermoplasmata archaeon]|nr:MAG: TIGR00296 family protein [Thermoplasmata archaeon]
MRRPPPRPSRRPNLPRRTRVRTSSASSRTSPRGGRDLFSDEEGILAVKAARAIVDSHVHGRGPPDLDLPGTFDGPGGVFTTLKTHPGDSLRGCIGIPEPIMSLRDALVRSAMSAATQDPRFPRVSPGELDSILVEVTLMTPPEYIEVESPDELLEKVRIGVHGLIAVRGRARGLLLPQVPVEQGWDTEEFLRHTCWKAGLPMESWNDGVTRFQWFTGQVFGEVSPRGEVRPEPLE